MASKSSSKLFEGSIGPVERHRFFSGPENQITRADQLQFVRLTHTVTGQPPIDEQVILQRQLGNSARPVVS